MSYQQSAGKQQAPNKVKFSSVKLGQTKQGSPTIGLYLKRDQAEKLLDLVATILQNGADGFKMSAVVISGKDYDSGYAYVDAKEPPRNQRNNAQPQQQAGAQNGNQTYGNRNAPDRSAAAAFLKGKRLNDGSPTGSGA